MEEESISPSFSWSPPRTSTSLSTTSDHDPNVNFTSTSHLRSTQSHSIEELSEDSSDDGSEADYESLFEVEEAGAALDKGGQDDEEDAAEEGERTPPSSFGSEMILSGKGKERAREGAKGDAARGVGGGIAFAEEDEEEAAGKGKGRERDMRNGHEMHQDKGLLATAGSAPRATFAAPSFPTSAPPLPSVAFATISASTSTSTSTTVSPAPSIRRPRLFSFSRSRSSSLSLSSMDGINNESTSNLSRSRPLRGEEQQARQKKESKGWKGRSKAKLAKVISTASSGGNKGRRATLQSLDTATSSSATSLSSIASHRSPSLTRARAYSAPLLHSPALSPLPATITFSSPLGELHPPIKLNLFDFLLPREIRLKVMKMLIRVCIEDWEKLVRDGGWKGEKARERWAGEAKGRRELIKVGRVSRTWLSLSLDGSLWPSIPISLLGPDVLSPLALLRLIRSSSSFVRHLDLSGMSNLDGVALSSMGMYLGEGTHGKTRLTELNLTGCRSIHSISLQVLIRQSPNLLHVNLASLPAVNDTIILALGETCHELVSLNVNHCPHLPASSFIFLPRNTLKILRAAKARHLSNAILIILGRSFDLSTLDVSHCTDIDDVGLEKIVECSEFDTERWSTKVVKVKDGMKRVLGWKHLNMSGCRRITDRGLQALAESVPELETLELANLGSSLHAGAGLTKLLWTTPNLVKLDLEDAILVDDQIFLPLTPSNSSQAVAGPRLEHLILAACITLTDEAIRRFVQQTSSLRTLELDGTVASEATAKAFVVSLGNRPSLATSTRLDPSVTPRLVSLLDARSIGRGLNKELVSLTSSKIRHRNGQRGHWTIPMDYDDDEANSVECEPSLVIVRSFYSSLSIDATRALRQKKKGLRRPSVISPGTVGDTSPHGLAVRRRAMSDLTRRSDDVARSSCVVS